MNVRVILPPDPIVTPADIPGPHATDDAAVVRMIAAATRTIEGPSGWLGRVLGPQTLELTGWFGCRRIRLPFPPIIEIVSITAEDRDGVGVTVDPSTYRRDGDCLIVADGASWVSKPIHRVRYEAGYNNEPVENGGTGEVPPEAIDAIIMLVQDRIRTGGIDASIRSETVEDVGSTTYLDADKFSALSQSAAANLLSGLRLYS